MVTVLVTKGGTAQHIHGSKPGNTEEKVFLSMMDGMMKKMEAVPEKSYASEVFMNGMIPHHQGAMEMADYEIHHGSNFAMLQLAKSILAEQEIEMWQMQLWLNAAVDPADTCRANSYFKNNMDRSMREMMTHLPDGDIAAGTDLAFALAMIPHHQAAIDMARAVIQNGAGARVLSFANRIIASQKIEIGQMLLFVHNY